MYKFLAKVLANKLRKIIGSVILDSHSTFVIRMQILDRILIANEVVDEAQKLKKKIVAI
jgi:hypothetical protein